MLTVLSGIAEFERDLVLQWINEGRHKKGPLTTDQRPFRENVLTNCNVPLPRCNSGVENSGTFVESNFRHCVGKGAKALAARTDSRAFR